MSSSDSSHPVTPSLPRPSPDVSPHLLAVARGEAPADLLLRNGRIVNVFSGDIEHADLAIAGDRIAGIGSGYRAAAEHDLGGMYVAPGLIDAHVHIESSMCLPREFARAVVPRGITTVIADPHEIANVAGAAGVRFMAEAARGLALRVVLMGPSCVPATHLATTGAPLTAEDLQQLLADRVVHGLAEVMNYPGVIAGDPQVLRKLTAFDGRPIDGHAPAVSGHRLCAYAAAGVRTDHECIAADEAREKLSRGLYVLIREASNARNLESLLPIVTAANSRRICFCTDDRTPPDLLESGSIDHMLRRAIGWGLDPVEAIRMATLNPAECYGLHDRGAIAPGRLADLVLLSDLAQPRAAAVYLGGRRVDIDVKLDELAPQHAVPNALRRSVHLPAAETIDFAIPARGERVRVIGCTPDQLVTSQVLEPPRVVDGRAVADPSRDLLKMAVIERHTASARMGLGFIQGFGLRSGAIAGTVAHDHHNLVVIGADDESMRTATDAVRAMGGGLAVASEGRAIASLPLPVAGLMSDRDVQFVSVTYAAVRDAARALGSPLRDPFMAMSFMALEVIPSLKLTDRGLVEVDAQRIVDLFV